MTSWLLAFLLLQLSPAPTGVATGVVFGANGLPAAGIRVYAIPAGDPSAATTNAASVFESLAQTDASGRYRLEVPAGRYYIAAGSVSSPTYYPNESSIASAKVVVIAARTTVDGVNFSKYVPTPVSPLGQRGGTPVVPPGSTGTLSGVIHYSDGTPASGITVVAAPASGQFRLVTVGNQSSPFVTLAVTDSAGRFRLQSVSPDTYHVVAGFSDSPTFFPGAMDVKAATAITTNPTTKLDNLDFTIPAVSGIALHVRVSDMGGRAAGGATLNLRRVDSTVAAATYFLPLRNYKQMVTAGDGSSEFAGVVPGKYSIEARLIGTTPDSRTIEIKNQAVSLDFALPIVLITGRVLGEDGRPFSDPVLNQVAVNTLSNPNLIETTILTLSTGGVFSGVVGPGEYRFFVRNLPEDYRIQSITSGATDLVKGNLKFDGDHAMDVEVRIAKKISTAQKVTGKVVDAVTGVHPAAERIQLCCMESGPVERMSAALHSDGTFEFSGVPMGQYRAELKGKTALEIMNSSIDVGADGKYGLTVVSATQFATLTTSVSLDNSLPWPGVPIEIRLTPATGEKFEITVAGAVDRALFASVPSGVQYNVWITNLPAGYKVSSLLVSDVQSVSPGIPSTPSSSSGFAGTIRVSGDSSITIALTRSE